ncbi:MAG: hypothetical protein PHP43_08190 [Methanoculleus sp.]|nr:hypothetical protein [Methanoculleus sp.]
MTGERCSTGRRFVTSVVSSSRVRWARISVRLLFRFWSASITPRLDDGRCPAVERPAFDVTPTEYVDLIVTEQGVIPWQNDLRYPGHPCRKPHNTSTQTFIR